MIIDKMTVVFYLGQNKITITMPFISFSKVNVWLLFQYLIRYFLIGMENNRLIIELL